MNSDTLVTKDTIATTDTLSGVEVSIVPKLCNPKNGLTNGIVCRASPGNKNRFVFFLQTGQTKDRQKRTALFVAQRQIFSKFYIFDVTQTTDVNGDGSFRDEDFSSKTDMRFVGKFSRIRTPSSYIGYNLFESHGERKLQVQSVLYQIPKTAAWMKGKTFRECHVIFFSQSEESILVQSARAREGGSAGDVVDKNRLEKDVKSVLAKKKNAQDVMKPVDGIHVTTTKLPKYNQKTSSFTTNFGGRCTDGDQLNMQLADLSTTNKKVNLQMAFWTKDEYSLDFTSPMSPFQAFGYALAQLDL